MNFVDNALFIQLLNHTKLKKFQAELATGLADKYANPGHGNFHTWWQMLESLPNISPSVIDLTGHAPIIGDVNDCTSGVRRSLEEKLKTLCPWRKGPFNVFGIHIDSEWRSDWKWSRVAPHVQLKGKLVLDIGCNNGYYALRMQAMGADLVIGIDSTWLYVFQFLALQKYLPEVQQVFVLPYTLEELPDSLTGFDLIFSMGVLYHQQRPQTHLNRIHMLLARRGQLILETLIIEDKGENVLTPNRRYANMRNVWALPSYALLKTWLKQSGFVNIRLIDVTRTTIEEQRRTQWMSGYSLANALNADNPDLTIEGYPAPLRAVIIVEKCSGNHRD